MAADMPYVYTLSRRFILLLETLDFQESTGNMIEQWGKDESQHTPFTEL